MNLDEDRPRTLATGLGAVSIGIGGVLALTPRLSGRLSGLPVGREPTAPVMFRAAGLRDLVVNVGLISAARHGGNYAPWLVARALSNAGDVVAVLLALVHSACDVLLWRVARRAGTGTPSAV